MNKAHWYLLGLVVGFLVLVIAPSSAQEETGAFQTGDVFAGVGNGKIKRFDADGNLIAVLDTTSGSSEETGMCFDSAGNLYTTNFSAQNMTWFDNSGTIKVHPWGGPFSSRPESCVVDAFGNVYTGEVDGAELIRKFDPQGNLLATYNPAKEDRGIDWIDLASDQCTMFYTSEGSTVKRFDVCTNNQLPDFATGLTRPCYALRIRSNKEVMVACASQVYRLDANGTPIQTYSRSDLSESSFFFALNLDRDGTSFWTAGFNTGNIHKVDIETGSVLNSFNAGLEGPSLAGLAVFSEITSGLADEDGDGLYDDWEMNGIDTDGDSERDLFLNFLDEVGENVPPDPRHKDVYVWVDWLDAVDHNHKPSEEALLKVKEAFAEAPVSHLNPDGKPGINLHIILGNAIAETPDLEVLGSFDEINGDQLVYNSQELSDLKWRFLQYNGARPGMAGVFHYAVFGHNLPEVTLDCPTRTGVPSGIGPTIDGENPGSDFIVADNVLSSDPLLVGGTFMHELGHTLDLGHGGPGISNDVNYKPNHLSVMNYSFTKGLFYGNSLLPKFRSRLDYSRFDSSTIPDLNENSLNERVGLNGGEAIKNYGTVYYDGYMDKEGEVVHFVNLPINWNLNFNPLETSVQANINSDDIDESPSCQEKHDTLTVFNEWVDLDYATGSIGTAAGLIQPYPSETFISVENVDLAEDMLGVTDGVEIIEIDVKPGSDPNSILCTNGREAIPVAILTTEEFDALTVDHATVTFEGAGEIHIDRRTDEPLRHEEDVDEDGDMDLVFHYRLSDTDLACDSTEGTLIGETFDGQAIEGTDSVRMLNPND